MTNVMLIFVYIFIYRDLSYNDYYGNIPNSYSNLKNLKSL